MERKTVLERATEYTLNLWASKQGKVFFILSALFLTAWVLHLLTATLMLRGFFGDGSFAFLLTLSKSYMFEGSGRWVYIFPAGIPREFQFLLNSLALQVALFFGVQSPLTFKYLFNFWQFFLPGFLYLGLFAVLAITRNAKWIIFPLLSWAILSIPIEWNAINSTRWAVPIFWAHFMLVILAGPSIRPKAAFSAILLGAAMLGGLYESIVLQAALSLAIASILWWKEKTITPIIYASAAIPGAIRSVYTYFFAGGAHAPNTFTSLSILSNPYSSFSVFIILSLTIVLLIALVSRHKYKNTYFLVPIPIALAIYNITQSWMMDQNTFQIWHLINFRFDYVFISIGLMALAGTIRLLKKTPPHSLPASSLALCLGTFLWLGQTGESLAWKDCRNNLDYSTQDFALITSFGLEKFIEPSPKIKTIGHFEQGQCIWDWAEPWTNMVMPKDGIVKNWPLYTFWQDFSFYERDGKTLIHSNNGTVEPPSLLPIDLNWPLRTKLYDLTSLYKKVGSGALFPRKQCIPLSSVGSYWYPHLRSVDDNARTLMHVCPTEVGL